MIALPEYFIERDRQFPRFHKSNTPRCPNCGAEMVGRKYQRKMLSSIDPNNTVMERIEYRCPIPGCHRCDASTNIVCVESSREGWMEGPGW